MRVGHDELVLDGGADDVPRARRHAAAALRGGPGEPLLGDVELVVSELVTNALLHAGTPAGLRVAVRSDDDGETVVRVEVRDPVRAAPIRAIASTEAMTGRGIALVEALSRSWGVEEADAGKVVWGELSTASAERPLDGDELGDLSDIDALLAAWDDEPSEPHRVTVRLGDVPTDLLLAAKGHVDNLVREFVLASSGAESGASAAVPAHLAQLVETVVHRFAEPRRAIKRQAVAAASAGAVRTDLVLTLTPANVESGRAYLEALDEADAYARAARLLTLETPAQHRVFRRWYVESLIGQVAAAVNNQPSPPIESFEARLLSEVERLAATQRATERAARLQEVTAALGATTTREEVADVVVIEGVAALGASGGTVLIPSDGGRAQLPGAYGYSTELLEHLRNILEDRDRAAARWFSGPIWIESRQDRDAVFPDLAPLEPHTSALCVVPLTVGERVVGALRFSFDNPRLFDDDERRFVLSLAAQTAQALDRSALLAAERSARTSAEALADRLARLQRVTADLTSAADVDQIGDIVVTQTAEALGAGLATLSLVVGDRLSLVRHRGDLQRDAADWVSYPVTASLPAGEAVLTQSAVVVDGPGELARRFPALGAMTTPHQRLVCVPLRFGQRVLGVLTLSFAADPEVFDERSVVTFLQTLCDAAAQAIQQYRALESARDANDKLAFLAQASAVMSSSLDQRETLRTIAQLVVPRLADLCAIHLVEDGVIKRVAVAHVASSRLAMTGGAEDQPVDADDATDVARVIRTGRSELSGTVTDASSVTGDEAERSDGLSSVLLVPMSGRSGVIGAIVLVHADSGRHYDVADQAMAEDLARRAAVAVENAELFTEQSGRLAAITRVAEAAQHAILAPVPPRIGPYLLSAAYVSAAREALIGGDLYEVVQRPDGLRLLIGDVRGKGLDAVRLATVVLGEFRGAAADEDELEEVARRVDRRLAAYLGEEDFVTALMVDLADDGGCRIVCCGHPPAIIARPDGRSSLRCTTTVPLGLGVRPVAVTERLEVGDRLLLFTDGLVEARRPDGGFVDLAVSTAPLGVGGLQTVLGRVLEALRQQVGPELGDDLALIAVEYRP